MPNLRESIQELLYLEKPLPASLTRELALGYKPTLKLHDQFTDIASEIRIWTFYETVDSTLSVQPITQGGPELDFYFLLPLPSLLGPPLRPSARIPL